MDDYKSFLPAARIKLIITYILAVLTSIAAIMSTNTMAIVCGIALLTFESLGLFMAVRDYRKDSMNPVSLDSYFVDTLEYVRCADLDVNPQFVRKDEFDHAYVQSKEEIRSSWNCNAAGLAVDLVLSIGCLVGMLFGVHNLFSVICASVYVGLTSLSFLLVTLITIIRHYAFKEQNRHDN